MIERIRGNWNFMRLLRLGIGVAIVVQGIIAKDIMFAIMGGLFSLMPLLNIGCCGSSGCGVPTRRAKQETQEIAYEEVL